ncbi:DNA methyltransferase [Altibacter lentus]|uniref:DNA methyltransferase n=1 Tax=Altibacter lentus TaxID=1223410 RepID=UPI000558BC99|nr:site-specific DNA-methyltransferase [Altibacter lentus]
MPVKYIPYVPNTVEGQAVLDNISRTQRVLRYRDNDKVISKIMRGMPYYEMEKQEQVGEESENLVIRGECLSACAYLKEQGIKVDLVYIDPPFASGADYAKTVNIRRDPKLAEKIKKAEEELEIDELKAFEETMYGDIWQKEDYLNWMHENLMAIKSIMSETASIYVHLDTKIGHYVKILLDEVFGEEKFINEIIWYYNDKFATGGNSMDKNHDNIFLYSKEQDYVFHPIIIPKDKTTTRALRKKVDGKTVNVLDENGNKIYEQYSEKKEDDVWQIGRTISKNEYLSYSTQKPEKLLSRIIKASSNKEMTVVDFFGGSGVTAKVAHDLGRKFIHVDIGINSIQTTRDRLVEVGASFQILEIKDGVSLFRNPQQTMDKLAKLIPGLQQKVPGVGKFWFGALQDSKLGTVPVYVPNLIDGSEKVLDVPAVNRIINEELQNLEINAQKAIVYYVDVDDHKSLEKFIKDNNATQTTIELKDLKEILHAIVVEDEIETKSIKTKEGFEVEITKFVSDRLNQKINDFNEKGNLQAINKGKKFSPITISEEGLELIEYLSLDCENAEGVWSSSSEIKIDKLGYISVNGQKTKDFWNGKISADKKPLRLKIRNISGDETVKVFE